MSQNANPLEQDDPKPDDTYLLNRKLSVFTFIVLVVAFPWLTYLLALTMNSVLKVICCAQLYCMAALFSRSVCASANVSVKRVHLNDWALCFGMSWVAILVGVWGGVQIGNSQCPPCKGSSGLFCSAFCLSPLLQCEEAPQPATIECCELPTKNATCLAKTIQVEIKPSRHVRTQNKLLVLSLRKAIKEAKAPRFDDVAHVDINIYKMTDVQQRECASSPEDSEAEVQTGTVYCFRK